MALRRPGQRPAAGDDDAIGRGIHVSLVLLGALVTCGALLGYVATRPDDAAPLPEGAPFPPVVPASALPAPTPTARFTDVTEAAGIDFVHTNGATGEKLLPEAMGGGCAFLDFDADGDQDLLFVNSAGWQALDPQVQPAPAVALYRNDGRGHFDDVTRDVGLDASFYGMGVAVGDVDGDGYVDLFFTAVGANQLFRNVGGARFENRTVRAGVAGAPDAWSTAAAFLDADNDGDLDLLVGNYLEWSRELDRRIKRRLPKVGFMYGSPQEFAGVDSYLYLNSGEGRFVDASAASGVQVRNPVSGAPVAKVLAFAPFDVDGDGWLDVYVANDAVKDFLLMNQGDGTFVDRAGRLGTAYNRQGRATHSMGLDVARFRNDAAVGVAVANFSGEMSSLFVSEGGGELFVDRSIGDGIGPPTRHTLGFGLFFFDYDLDGRLDLFQANGHIDEDVGGLLPFESYEQPAQLFWNCGDACDTTFVEVPADRSGALARPLVGRCAAYGDIEGDGDLDVAISQIGRRAVLLRNDVDRSAHWLRIRLVGAGSNRDAIGASIEVHSGGVVQRRQVMPTRSYLAQVELPVTFGLGPHVRVDEVRIVWPGGRSQSLGPLPVDRALAIREPGD